MRKNKTYEQQKKFYDKNSDYESLGALFKYWLECGNETAAQMQETYREGTKECKDTLWKTSSTFATRNNSISLLESSILARSNHGAVSE